MQRPSKKTREQRQRKITKNSKRCSNTNREQTRKYANSYFTKLENKIEQITKIANERLRIDLRSQIDQLNVNLQNTIKINEKSERKH